MQIEKPPSKNKPFKKCFSSLVSLCLWRPNKSCKQCFAQSKNRTDITHWDFLPKFLSLRYYTTLEGVFGVQRSGQGQGTIICFFSVLFFSQNGMTLRKPTKIIKIQWRVIVFWNIIRVCSILAGKQQSKPIRWT